MITPYVTLLGRSEFERNKTGFGYMVYDIAKEVGSIEDVTLFATDSRGAGFEKEGVRFVKRSLWLMFRNVFRCVKPRVLYGLLHQFRPSMTSKIRLWYYWLLSGYFDRLLTHGEYDVIHIHGCSLANELWMAVCRKHDKRFMVTLHGLNSFSDTVNLGTAEKQYERFFLRQVVGEGTPITVISTGMKRLIENAYGVNKCKSITVICNSFSFSDHTNSTESIRQQYNIPQGGKVLLCVGNITKNKNQIQLVRAFGLLPERMQQNTYVLFCGRPDMSCGVEEEIAKQRFASHLIMCGGKTKAELPSYYLTADGVVLLSFAEGFGLSLIEGMCFGKPCVTFEDLASYDDIYDPCGVIGVSNREDSSVAIALEKCLSLKWDETAIKKSSLRFDRKQMANNYINAYNALLC